MQTTENTLNTEAQRSFAPLTTNIKTTQKKIEKKMILKKKIGHINFHMSR